MNNLEVEEEIVGIDLNKVDEASTKVYDLMLDKYNYEISRCNANRSISNINSYKNYTSRLNIPKQIYMKYFSKEVNKMKGIQTIEKKCDELKQDIAALTKLVLGLTASYYDYLPPELKCHIEQFVHKYE